MSFLLVAFVMAAGMLLAARLLRVKTRADLPTKRLTYECGEEPDGPAWLRFHPRYYLVAILFVIFDVEAIFLLPWALNIESLGLIAIVDMFIFLAVLLGGLVWAWRKGALEWQ